MIENEGSDDNLLLCFVNSNKTEIKVGILFISLSWDGLDSSNRLQ